MIIDQKTLRVVLERRQSAQLWGSSYRIIPRLLDQVFGNGEKLIAIQPFNTRPNFYYARIDSSWSTSNWDHESEMTPSEWVDDIIDALRKQFGDKMDSYKYKSFPVVDADDGFGWQEEEWPESIAEAPIRNELLRFYRKVV